MRLTLHAFVGPDGVMQAPGGPGEDPGAGSSLSGWSFLPMVTQDVAAAMAGWWHPARIWRRSEHPRGE